MTQRVTGQRFRQRKLSTKQSLAIFRESEIDASVDDAANSNIPKFETGVEKAEEIEHHLQAAIASSHAAAVGGKISQIYIPTPDAVVSSIKYHELYSRTFSQPSTYIRFSSTVEDCVNPAYCMTADDEAFLRSYNAKRSKSSCSEEQFEEVISFFEDTATTKQPFSNVGETPVLPFEEMENTFDDALDDSLRKFAKDFYEYWKSLRVAKSNRPLMPNLKFETGQETDDNDPYVCFRRREVRQVRKTRGRDAQVTEKLKKLRKELEDARELIHYVKRRELLKRDQLAAERDLFKQRVIFKETKRKLGMKDPADDELLINQKPSVKKAEQKHAPISRTPTSVLLRPPQRPDGRPVEQDLVLLEDKQAERDREIERQIDDKIIQHENWNKNWVDLTWRPITPPQDDEEVKHNFRTAVTEYLPTPPSSVSSESSGDNLDNVALNENSMQASSQVKVRFVTPPSTGTSPRQPSFRRRRGRGGRMMVDRRNFKFDALEPIDERTAERFRYDQDEDEDEDMEDQLYPVDLYGDMSIKYRSVLLAVNSQQRQPMPSQIQTGRPASGDVQMANGQGTAGMPASRQMMSRYSGGPT